MSRHTARDFDLDDDEAPEPPGRLSANAHWLFGSLYALMALVGFAFGVWAGAQKPPKPVEVADAQKEAGEKPPEKQPDKPAPKPPVGDPPSPGASPAPVVRPPEPKPKEPDPRPVKPAPKPKEPEPKPKEPEPKPVIKPVAFKEVVPILRSYCFDCHGAVGKPKGGVDLTSVAKIRDSKNMPLVPGKPKESALYTSVANRDMPPDGKKGPTPEELKVLHDWIASGARERRRGVRGRRKLELTRGGGAG